MSLGSKIALVGSFIFSGSIIGYVHYKQHYDREKLHEGVIKDVERQQRRKIENIYLLQQQNSLEKKLRQLESESVNSNSNVE